MPDETRQDDSPANKQKDGMANAEVKLSVPWAGEIGDSPGITCNGVSISKYGNGSWSDTHTNEKPIDLDKFVEARTKVHSEHIIQKSAIMIKEERTKKTDTYYWLSAHTFLFRFSGLCSCR